MGKRGPKPLSADQLERQGSLKTKKRRDEENKRKELIADVFNQTILETYFAKCSPFKQAEIDDAVDYFTQLGPEEFIRVITWTVRAEFVNELGIEISKKKLIDILKKDF